jgi:hypothetical protein
MQDGSPVRTWSQVSSGVPVLYSKDQADFDPSWTAEQRREADQRGTLFALPKADIRPGDHVIITRPVALALTLEVQADPSTVPTLHGASHREYKVRSVG